MAESNQKQYQIKIKEETEQGVYANAVSVHINNNECVLDMAYLIPNPSPDATPTLKLVSRINMNHKTAESFLKALSNAILDWKNKNQDQQQ
ncbi:hypothetical protein CVV38_02950 [Candidatus Peregrinibacteria bacterium HGW-Peregrinibacteria-1]|jgi:hypothetical protein|nr:MAG: hypothetical protein CVV38_02950 [Candidatus Peregrinibacteria bacterium HGW-Peregrinibacteria-1]